MANSAQTAMFYERRDEGSRSVLVKLGVAISARASSTDVPKQDKTLDRLLQLLPGL